MNATAPIRQYADAPPPSKVLLIHCEMADMARAADDLADIAQKLIQRLTPYCTPVAKCEGPIAQPEAALPKFGEEFRSQRRKIEESVRRLNSLMETLEL